MSLATRCTSCGTVFRVVQDQLKVSEGWVRCGRCEQVFNALEGLFDLERDTPPGGAAAHFEDVHAPNVDVRSGAPVTHDEDSSFSMHQLEGRADDDTPEEDPHLVERIDAHLFGTRRSESNTRPSELVSKRDRHEFSDARFDTDIFVDDEGEVMPGIGTEVGPTPLESAPAKLERVAPEFVRQAQRRARWQQPRVRAALAVAFVLLALGLTLQMAHHFRDTVAARWPSVKPLMLSWCDLAGCKIGTPRRIDDIVVDSTALGKITTDSGDAFRLSVTLRNRGQLAVAMPSIDLSLTDSGGQLLARRVLAPSDFRSTLTALQPGGDVTLQAPLAAGALRVSGFTVEIFYP